MSHTIRFMRRAAVLIVAIGSIAAALSLQFLTVDTFRLGSASTPTLIALAGLLCLPVATLGLIHLERRSL